MHSIPTFLVIFFFQLDPNELSALFNEKTKAIIFNNPNNPLGKVYNREEIEMIAELCKKHNVLIISDDVYEHMVSTEYSTYLLNPYGRPYFYTV